MFGSKLKARIEELMGKVSALEGELAQAKEALEKAQAAGGAQADSLAEAEAQREDLEKQLKAAQDDNAQLKKTLDETAAKLAAAQEDKRRTFAAQLPGGATAKPAAYGDAVDGAPAPVAEGTESAVATWADAVAHEKGDYAAARVKYRELYYAKYPQLAPK